MSYNSKAYLAYEERRLEPSIIVTGTHRRYQPLTSQQGKNRWIDSLTAEQREQLAREYEEETNKNQHRL